MRDRVALDLQPAGTDVDVHNGRMYRVAPGHRRRLPIIGLLQSRIDTGRPAVIPARPRGLRDLAQRHRHLRYADHAYSTVAQLEIVRTAFQQVRGDRKGLLAQSLAGMTTSVSATHFRSSVRGFVLTRAALS